MSRFDRPSINCCSTSYSRGVIFVAIPSPAAGPAEPIPDASISRASTFRGAHTDPSSTTSIAIAISRSSAVSARYPFAPAPITDCTTSGSSDSPTTTIFNSVRSCRNRAMISVNASPQVCTSINKADSFRSRATPEIVSPTVSRPSVSCKIVSSPSRRKGSAATTPTFTVDLLFIKTPPLDRCIRSS